MDGAFRTDQEAFWAGRFGDDYTGRNITPVAVAECLPFLSDILRRTHDVKDTLELGANLGINTLALQMILPQTKHSVVEINESAIQQLKKLPGVAEVFHASILDFRPHRKYDFVFTKGVLIHINPDHLPSVYETMYTASSRYIMVAEYYNPTPTTITYRGHRDRLFKRDFAGDLLERFHDLRLVDYAFIYRRDPNFRQDDLTWFLLEKT